MKKQNLIIIGIFIIVVFGFYLISCNNDEKPNVIGMGSETDYLKVKVYGEVLREGEYSVPSSWTLEKLFDYVGLKNTADLTNFDFTTQVSEGSYYIPKLEANKVSMNKKVNINKASKEELTTLTGIGDSIASRIISYREKTPFTSIEELKKISGIGEKVYEKIKDFITV